MKKCKVLAVLLLLAAFAGFGLTQDRSALRKSAARTDAAIQPGRGTAAREPGASSARVAIDYARLPLQFEANQGQTDPRVKFLAHGSHYTLFLTADEAVVALKTAVRNACLKDAETAEQPAVVRLAVAGANPGARVEGLDRLPGVSNYFIGNDPRQWRTGVPNYARVRYRRVYPGVELIYYGNQQQLEYDFVIAPGADPRRIELRISGTRRTRLNAHGDLQLETADGEVRLLRPLIFQQSESGRREIAGGYVLHRGGRVGFDVGPYDSTRPLVIDPTLLYSTYLGGAGTELAGGIVIDNAGSAYLTGSTQSTNFPVVGTVPGPVLRGVQSAYVSKLSPSGSSLVYSTFVGGSNSDTGLAIALDSNLNVYVTGNTISPDFALVKPFQSTLKGTQNAFAFKLNASGTALVYSTYLGGNNTDTGNSIAVDSAGEAFVVGQTNSTNLPSAAPLQSALNGAANAFVSKLKADGSGLLFSTYLGGSGTDSAAAVALDSSGDAYVAGSTTSLNFPTMTPFQANLAGSGNAFVTKINSGGTALAYSTYLGGSGLDQGAAITVDGSKDAFLTGTTTSPNFPKMNAFQPALGGDSDAFVTELNPSGTALVYSTYLGGTSGDRGFGIALDSMGNAYITGQTRSTNFPTVHPFEPSLTSAANAFVAELQSGGSALVYSTYLGGSSLDFGSGIAVDSMGNAYVTGTTQSTDFPLANPEQKFSGGSSDAFVAKVTHTASPGALVSPTSLLFPDTMMSMQSAALMFTLSNQGDAALAISNVQLTGTNPTDFAQTNNCNSSVSPGGNCTFNVTFKPTTGGIRTAAVTITDNALGSPRNVVLSGNGVAPTPTVSLFPSVLVFSGVAAGQKSQPQPVTLTNNGTAALTITSIQFMGTNKNDFSQTNNCGSSVAINATCTINVVFTPGAAGQRLASMVINDNAADTPQSVGLVGGESYVVFALPSPLIVTAGQTAVATVFVTPGNGFNQMVTFSCSGNPAGSSCVFNPTSVTLDGTDTAQTQVTVTTTARSISAPRTKWLPPGGFRVVLPWLVLLAAVVTLALRLVAARRRVRLGFAAAFLLIALAAGCGGGGPSTRGTPAGTFTITINGKAGSLTQTGTLVLIVN